MGFIVASQLIVASGNQHIVGVIAAQEHDIDQGFMITGIGEALAGAEQSEHADGIDCGGGGQGQLRGSFEKSAARQSGFTHFLFPLL